MPRLSHNCQLYRHVQTPLRDKDFVLGFGISRDIPGIPGIWEIDPGIFAFLSETLHLTIHILYPTIHQVFLFFHHFIPSPPVFSYPWSIPRNNSGPFCFVSSLFMRLFMFHLRHSDFLLSFVFRKFRNPLLLRLPNPFFDTCVSIAHRKFLLSRTLLFSLFSSMFSFRFAPSFALRFPGYVN